jgi:hypothetical protein
MSDDNGIRQYQNPDGSVVIQDGAHGNDIHVIGGGGIDSASVDMGDAVGSCESVR